MLKQGGGAIVNISSTQGFRARPDTPAYAASKHGVIGLTKSTALAYADRNIRVNAVCPSTTDTGLLDTLRKDMPERYEALVAEKPMKRFAQPEEIANAILWLCSAEASYCTGHCLVIDGGFLA